ncbi:MAG: ABC transporter substrate-binding protein [Actinomycetales bacterium]|uniref:ABC transporter substrate-binding protein n=1 Tax=Candidatus Phosphoribacter hodrii TaxID=2953743 RepID=A0A9D7T750_9MICO|nr:ABC transporter substrate-binding protein [Candidatus Phosphoribacter hodrii]
MKLLALLGVVGVLAVSGCTATGSVMASGTGVGAAAGGSASTLRLGYFANLTHATAVLGVKDGHFAKALGTTTLQTQVFNAGPAAVEALLAGAIDAAYLGPSPAINAFSKSQGTAIRIVAGGTSGGASFVVRPGLTESTLADKVFASPQLGGTQDVALRSWLSAHGYTTTVTGGGNVLVAPQSNAQTLSLFKAGAVDGAWLPEPWASRLRLEAGATTLVDEATLWPQGRFVTTNLVVSTTYLQAHPEQVKALLQGAVAADAAIAADPEGSRDSVGSAITALTGAKLSTQVLHEAWSRLTITPDPIASSLQASATAAAAVGITKSPPDLSGIYDLTLLNQVLTASGRPTVSAGGLGKE